MNLGHNCIGMSRLWSLPLPTSVYNIFVRIYWTLEKLCNFPNFGVAEYIAYLRDLQHKISKCLRWRTCFRWIWGTIVLAWVDNGTYYCLQVLYNIFVRIYWTLEKLCNFPNFGVADYIAFLRDLQHKISKCLRWRTCYSDEFGAQLYWKESSMKYCSPILVQLW